MRPDLFGEPTAAKAPPQDDFWSLCRSIDASELDAELLAWGMGHGQDKAIDAIRGGLAKGREWIDKCLGSIARKRCEVEPCYNWLADHRHGAAWRGLRAVARIPDPVEPPPEPIIEGDYVRLPIDRLSERVLEAIANGETMTLRPENAPPCRCKP